MREDKVSVLILLIVVNVLVWNKIFNPNIYHKAGHKLPVVCYVDQQVIEEPFCFPKLRTYRIITSIYIEKDSCKVTLNTWEDIASEETLQEKKEDRLNQANDLRFETNMGIITGKINICE